MNNINDKWNINRILRFALMHMEKEVEKGPNQNATRNALNSSTT